MSLYRNTCAVDVMVAGRNRAYRASLALGRAAAVLGLVDCMAARSSAPSTYVPEGARSTDGYVFGASREHAIISAVPGRPENPYANVKGHNGTYDLPGASSGTFGISNKSRGHSSGVRFMPFYPFQELSRPPSFSGDPPH